MEAALIGFACLLVLILLRVPIAFAMAIVGVAGFSILVGWRPAFAMVGRVVFDNALSYGLSVVPLFILMGNFVTRAGLSDRLYAAAHSWLGHRRGGLAMATVVACGGFSAVCGSSLATAATMARVAMPSMRRYGYADSLAAGSIAAGGTLGILIPPSVILILYGVMTSQDIGMLFAAGLVPGLLGILLYLAAVRLATARNPDLGPRAERATGRERLKALGRVWGVLLLFVVVMGGIYGGVFTPTEAAGIGAAGALVFARLQGGLSFSDLVEVLTETAVTTATVFAVLFGALLFSNFINVAGLPSALASWAGGLDLPPAAIVACMLAVYLVLGCVLESLSMVLLTVPVFYPLVQQLGLDLVWFGVLVVVVTEISLITPPVGLNVYVLRSVLPDVRAETIFRGILPFILADVVRLALIAGVPAITLLLPSVLR
ncbi:MAG: C4-dicarboxylate ABC transporter permease [Rhodospirillaceae bacterium]|nr:C4-dicarboxylate ABC transporter permease [Rhodospirillaceae bacterium]